MSHSTEAVLASRTLADESVQRALSEISGNAELVRLALAGRMLLITAAERAVSGWHKYGVSTKDISDWSSDAVLRQCRWTLINDPAHVTTSARAIFAVFLTGGLVLLATFSGFLLRFFFWRWLCVFTIQWRMRTAAHLHQVAIKRGQEEKFWPAGIEVWPVGRGFIDRVGVVCTHKGYHAVYRLDAELRYLRQREIREKGGSINKGSLEIPEIIPLT